MHSIAADITQQWRSPMLRVAQLHLPSREEAEDAVQDTLTALLLLEPDSFDPAQAKSYLFGILRNKISDRLRQKYRAPLSYDEAFNDDLDQVLFDKRGHWVDGVAPASWVNPQQQLQNDQFFSIVDLCVHKLPAKPARVFSMKEFLECEADEICSTLGITKADYWQCMSRARKQLQLCLHQNWFDQERAT
ncbi:sigma-70 family RNA polymerase sigma factor [Comamonas piscis]|uniref:Sigma-70 family RNA polymerase sigma factor n=1 Tax=Comamonas piscis TaxID=1562974 RepID=A0A7G5EEI0_9BURK|nr:sigma-70 family RNA polymerase sigma factor [Comamonas piscis]QMV72405.1 sigma-70 family RNA polymerase sigma factor [Comamonas piscis]WSO35173.1 sigma-70 family RNA polymerase sigma factor [Comamonas piscis]